MRLTFLILVFIATSFAQSGCSVFTCPNGWSLFLGNCYNQFAADGEGMKTFVDAQSECVKQSANLVSILNQNEQDFVGANFPSTHFYAWIGLKTMQITKPFVFAWTDGNSVTRYDNFLDEFQPRSLDVGYVMTLKPYRWEVWNPKALQPYICKKRATVSS